MKTGYHKLVRNRIPEIIEGNGEIPNVTVLEGEELLAQLDRKLLEEAEEYQESGELEELADILEVVYAICKVRGFSLDELHQIREQKKASRGGFSKGYFLLSKESGKS